ncbi:MAG: transposase [Nitrosomonadaceae bacterium]
MNDDNKRTKYNAIPLHASIYLRFLYQDLGIRGNSLTEHLQRKGFPVYAQRSIFRHAKKPLFELKDDRRKSNTGRRKKLDSSATEKVIKALKELRKEEKDFCSTHIQKRSGISEKLVGNRTLRRCLNDSGYYYMQCRKKGLLNEDDLVKRLQFAHHHARFPARFWRTGISFYLDGTGWVHKRNPSDHAVTLRTRTWRKIHEGLKMDCTAKGKKEGVAGKMAKFMVAIAHGKGVIDAIHYSGNINGEKFAGLVRQHFPDLFEKSSNADRRIFLQDGDSSQNAAIAKRAMEDVRCWVFHIPAKSPDCNPIENVFHLVGKKIKKDGRDADITCESYEEFVSRCRDTLLSFPVDVIDRTIDSMPKRLKAIIAGEGQRTKY